MERDKNKPSSAKTPETSRSSTSTRPSVKTTKEKLIKEEIDTSHLSGSIPKTDTNTPLLSISSPNNGKILEQRLSVNNTLNISSPEVSKNEKNDYHSEKVSTTSSNESLVASSSTNNFPTNQAILLTPPINTNSTSIQQTSSFCNPQASPNNSVNLKNVRRKDNTPLSPKSSATPKENIRSLKQVPSPKSYLKLKSEKQDKSKRKGTSYIPGDSPGKDGIGRSNPSNTSQENILDAYSIIQPGSAQLGQNKISEEFVNYYKQERPKLNVWTYLFKNLTNSISQIYTMCDLENSIQFNSGVISTLETALEDMKKLNKKIDLDNIKENKPIMWEIPGTSSEIQNKQEIENFLEDIENPDTVDFTLLTQLIQDGKMSLQEAIVLVVRERAMLIDDNALNMMTNSQGFHSDNLSFTSKIGHDFSIDFQKDIRDTKDSKEESLNPPFQIVSEGQGLLRRSRSQTPGRISLVKLINRLNWKLQDKKKDADEGYASEDYTREELTKNRLTQKQLRAESNRKELEVVRQDYLQKELSKITEAREKVAKQQSKKVEAFSKKQGDAEGRYEAKLTEKKRKAKNESDKVNEVAFISILEKQNKKLTLDQKVKETRERRLNIIENIKHKLGERSIKEDAASKRRAAQQRETEGRLKSKLEEAENRRNKIYEEKKKVLGEESKKLVDATNRKKILGYKDIHMKKGEDQTFKSRVDHLRVILLEEQQKINKRLAKKDTKSIQPPIQKIRKFSILDSSEDDLSFVRAKRARSVKTEDENEGSIILGDQPIVFYEPKSKDKTARKIEVKTSIPTPTPTPTVDKSQIKKGKKKKKKKDIEVIQKEDEEDKFKTLYVLIRSFSQPNMRTPKLKDLRLKLEAAEEKKAIMAKNQKPSISTSSSGVKKPEKVEINVKSLKEGKEKETKVVKHGDGEISAAKRTVTKQKSIGSSSSDVTHSVSTEEKKSSRHVVAGQASITARKERSSVLEKEESITETDVTSIGNISIKEKETGSAVLLADKITEDTEENEKMNRSDVAVVKEEESEIVGEESKDDVARCSGDDKMIRWCSICDFILENEVGNDEHIGNKQHRKIKMQYNLSNNDDTNCILEFKTSDINSKLKAERWNTLKKRCKKIKQRLVTRALKRENSMIGGKEVTSINKQRLQKLCLDLDKQVATQIKDFEAVDSTLKDILKLLDNQKEADLHIMRQLKFVPILMEICKRVSVCHKNEIDSLLKALDSAIKILTKFCGLIDNRTYMIVTNRLVPLVDLLIWCLNRPTKFVYSLTFVPHLFTILGRHLSQRQHQENAGFKEDVIEYIFCSGLIMKLQHKFMSFNGGLDLTTSMGKVPLALLKSVSFLEVLTSVVDAEHNTERSIFDQPTVSENIVIALKETEFIGMFSLLASLLLSDGSYIKQPNKVMPQTVLSVAMTTVKFFNNVARIMLEPFQSLLGSKELQEQVYHVFGYLLTYCTMNYDNSEDVKDLLDELLLMIGYFCVLNTGNQEILGKGMSTVIEKLNALPFPYFTDKKMKDILFPTLLCAVFQIERNLEIVYQEVSKEHLDKFLQSQMQLYPLDFITEKEEGYFTPSNQDISLNASQFGNESWNNKPQEMKFLKGTLSVSSNTSSTTSLFNVKASNSHHFSLICRFPRNKWDELLKFIHSK